MQVALKDKMGSDITCVNAARVSFAKESSLEYSGSGDATGWLSEKDAKLIKYLAEHNHWSPFAHPQLQLHVKAPLFVARQLAKHQVGLVWNEVSRRYVDIEPEFYQPAIWREKATDKKQGSLSTAHKDSELIANTLKQDNNNTKSYYNLLIKSGVCPEQARMVLPQNTYVEWYWTGSLYAFSRVCNLRCAPDTQEETRVIADQIKTILETEFPVSTKYLLKGLPHA